MKIDTECHLRINEVTDCGCIVLAIVRTDTAVPVRLDAHPVIEKASDGIGLPYDSLTHYDVHLRIAGKPAADVVPRNSSVELWVPVAQDNTTGELPAPNYGYLLLRHLVDGVKAMPWHPCPEHQTNDDTRRAGDILSVIGNAQPGERPEWVRSEPKGMW